MTQSIRNRAKKVGAIFLILPILCGCSAKTSEVQTWAYDTLCSAKIVGLSDAQTVFYDAVKRGENLLDDEGNFRFLAKNDGDTLLLGDEMLRIFRIAQTLTRETDGKFDLTVAPLCELWNFSEATEPPSREQIDEALKKVGMTHCSLNGNTLTFDLAGCGIDIGSVGKGYGATETANALRNAGATAGVLSFGGNVVLFGGGENGYRVAVRDPNNPDGYLGILTADETSVVTAGAYERCFEYDGKIYHHLLDATTGYPCESDLLSVTVLCEDGAAADLFATACWLAGEENGIRILQTYANSGEFSPMQAIFVCKDGRVRITNGLNGSFELTADGYRTEVLP